MINRVLIRMKAVQLLYSYLLVDKQFSLESQPSAPTKEKRFAFSLYMDLVYLMDRLAHSIVGKNKSYPLKETRFILKVSEDDKIKSLAIKYGGEPFPFDPAEDELKSAIKESLLFKEFEKQRAEGLPYENFWEDVFNSIIILNPKVNEIIRQYPGYSPSGVDRMKAMMAETFKNYYSSKDNIEDSLKVLTRSLGQARDLYMLLLALIVDLSHLRLEQLEQNRRKLLATPGDLNPNMRLATSPVAAEIERNPMFADYVDKQHISWKTEDPELLEHLLKKILDSELYKAYETQENHDIKADADFWRNVILELILEDQYFLEYMENKSVFWNDDLEIMASFVLKTLKKLENPETVSEAVLPMYKDGENGKDAKFGSELFRYVVRNKDLYRHYIEEALAKDKWDSDRLAFLDVVITMTALAEIINYPEIPLSVSINEYIEIAKSYSSSKSGQFVNGLLASILPNLKEEGIIQK